MTAPASAPRLPNRPPLDSARRELVTPEGVDLRLQVATYGERIAAFVLDLVIQALALAAFTLVLLLAAWATRSEPGFELMGVVWLLGGFALRNFYFMAFEAGPRGATPGKRALGLRVAAADGGRLTADAVFARNAMRELEVFLPLSFLGARGQGVDAGLLALGALWSGVFLLFPLFNRDRRRIGDLVAGTLVIKAPRALLRPDLAEAPLAGEVRAKQGAGDRKSTRLNSSH